MSKRSFKLLTLSGFTFFVGSLFMMAMSWEIIQKAYALPPPGPTMTAITDDANGDGTVDKITITFSEASDIVDGNAGDGLGSLALGNGCTIPNGDYAANGVSSLVLTNLTGCTLGETGITPTVTYTAVANCATAGAICDDAQVNQMASHFIVAADGAKPVIAGVDFATTLSGGILYNSITIAYSEPIKVSRDGGGDVDIAAGNNGASTATLGDMTAARTLTGIGSWDGASDMTTSSASGNTVALDGTGRTLTVLFNTDAAAYFNAGSVAPATPVFTPIADAADIADAANNPVNTATKTAINSNAWNITPPMVNDTYSCDVNGDGRIERMQVNFNKDILDISFIAGNFEMDMNSTNDGDGESPGDTFNTATAGCDGNPDDADTNDNKIRIENAAGVLFSHEAYLHHVTLGARDHAGNRLALGDALGTEHDMAKPVITAIHMNDFNPTDGKVSSLSLFFSENLADTPSGANGFVVTSAANHGACGAASIDPDGTSGYTMTVSCPNLYTAVGDLTLTFTENANIKDPSNNQMTNKVFTAASTPAIQDRAAPFPLVNSNYRSDSNADGRLDTIALYFSENTTFTMNGADWAFSVPGDVNFSGDFAAGECTGSGSDVIICTDAGTGTFNADINKTGKQTAGGTQPIWNYTNNGNRISDASGNNTASFSRTLSDWAPAVIFTRVTKDTDTADGSAGTADGRLDGILATFTEIMDASTVGAGDFIITTNAGGALTEAFTDITDDTTLFFRVTDAPANNTGELLKLQITGGDNIQDLAGGTVGWEGASVAATDGAAPFFVSAAATGNTTVQIQMSEALATVTFGAAGAWTATGLTSSGAAINADTAKIDLTVNPLNNIDYTSADFAFSTGAGGVIRDAALNNTASFAGKNITDGQANPPPPNPVITDTGGGGGGGGGSSIPPTSNTQTNNTPAVISTVTGNQTYNRPVQLAPEAITTDPASGDKTAQVTGETGTLTIKPNSQSTISLIIPPNTSVEGSSNWNGRINPPLIKSISLISKEGAPIEGSSDTLTQPEVSAVIKIGSDQTRLDFSNKIQLYIPVSLPEGTSVTLYFSNDGKTWTKEGTGIVKNGKVIYETTHLTYFAVEKGGSAKQAVPAEKAKITELTVTFKDIRGHWAEAYIKQAFEKGIVAGKTATVFAPNTPITRAEFAKMVLIAFDIKIPAQVTKKPFSDVPLSAWYAPYLQAAKTLGIIQGVGNLGLPDLPVARDAALKILIKAAGFDITGAKSFNFKDTEKNVWYTPYLNYAKANGIMEGYADGTFRPGRSLSRAEAVKIILKALELKNF